MTPTRVPLLLARAFFLASALLCASCATPARPIAQAAGASDALSSSPHSPSSAAPLNGLYDATIHTRWFGPVRARFIAQPTAQGFKANTAPGVAWDLVGGVEQVLGPLFTPFMFPSGMLVIWSSTTADTAANRPGEGWIGVSTIGPFRAKTKMSAPDGPVEIQFRDGRTLAVMTLAPASGPRATDTDYPALADDMQRVFREQVYDPELADSRAVREFFTELREASEKTDDDLTFGFAAAMAWRKRSNLPLPLPYRRPDPEAEAILFASVKNPAEPLRVRHDEKSGIVTIDALAFLDPAAVDAAFRAALEKQPTGIILDLKDCAGPDLAAWRVVAWLTSAPTDAGTYFGRRARADVLARKAADIPTVTLESPADFQRADATLNEKDAVHLSVTPVGTPFAGPVTVVISARTRSTAEALAWVLKTSGRVTTVGESTAGRARLSCEHELPQNFLLRFDTFDWINPDGARLTKPGVRPDVAASRETAPARAAEAIRAKRDRAPG